MSDESVKRAAQEYLAEKRSAEGLTLEQTLNRDAAIALGPAVWRKLAEAVVAMCNEWNAVTIEQSLTGKETMLGDLRIRCAGRPYQLVFHYQAKKRVVKIENTARAEHEPEMILSAARPSAKADRFFSDLGFSHETGLTIRLIRLSTGFPRCR
jgi:hypothetical protein